MLVEVRTKANGQLHVAGPLWREFCNCQGCLASTAPNQFRYRLPKADTAIAIWTAPFSRVLLFGAPQYDEKGYYVGPLPRLHNQPSMRDRATTGPFKTTGTEQWPIRMCQWIAPMLLHSCSAAATTAIEGRRAEDEDTLENSDKGYPICQPEGHRLQGRRAPQEHAKPCQATRTSTTVGGYAHLGDGESRFGS